MPTGALVTGDLAFTQSTSEFWFLNKSSTAALTSVTIASKNSVNGTRAGRWLRLPGHTDFIQVGNSQQFGIGLGTDIVWRTPGNTNTTNIAFDGTLFTLQAGKSYLLQASLIMTAVGDPAGQFTYHWVNTANAQVGGAADSGGTILRGDTTELISTQSVSTASLINLTTDLQVKVRVTAATSTFNSAQNQGWAVIRQIS